VPQNSLRSLRSLHSNSCGKSVDEARCARRPRPCAPRATEIAPTGCRLPLWHRFDFSSDKQRCARKGACGQAGARLWSAEKRRARGLARSASRDLTCRRLFERSERSERSEFGDRPRAPASQGSRSEAQGASAKRLGLPARAFARTNTGSAPTQTRIRPSGTRAGRPPRPAPHAARAGCKGALRTRANQKPRPSASPAARARACRRAGRAGR
jgi:hypothetical protein